MKLILSVSTIFGVTLLYINFFAYKVESDYRYVCYNGDGDFIYLKTFAETKKCDYFIKERYSLKDGLEIKKTSSP